MQPNENIKRNLKTSTKITYSTKQIKEYHVSLRMTYLHNRFSKTGRKSKKINENVKLNNIAQQN